MISKQLAYGRLPVTGRRRNRDKIASRVTLERMSTTVASRGHSKGCHKPPAFKKGVIAQADSCPREKIATGSAERTGWMNGGKG